MKAETHKNRYGEVFTFTPTPDGNVIWEGNFEWCRIGYPTDYTNAYNTYIADGGMLELEEFIEEVHRSIYGTNGEYIGPSDMTQIYGPLVETRKDIIDMVDPSGGPYLSGGMPSTMVHSKIKDKTISHFIPLSSGGYKIILT